MRIRSILLRGHPPKKSALPIFWWIGYHLLLLIGGLELSAQQIGAIASPHPLATEVGMDILNRGGNAFDAAIAIAATLNVVEPAMSGLGGYGSTLIYDVAKKEIRFLNSSGRFPRATNSDFMRPPAVDYMKNRTGPKSISTPGSLNGWHELHRQYGSVPWERLFEWPVYYAKNGFPLPPYTAKLIEGSYVEFSDSAKLIYGKNGKPLGAGEILVQNDLARTYELIAKKGIEPFYRGEIAVKIERQMKDLGGFLSLDDLKDDRAEWEEPMSVAYRGYDIYTIGTPGNGFTALFALGVMEQFPLEKMDHNSISYLHILIETLKETCKVRLQHAGAPEEKRKIIESILTKPTFSTIAQGIDRQKASKFDLIVEREGLNTTHFVVIDRWGNIVSSTQTLGLGFGSKVMIEGTGIWMNNSMAFATFEPKGNPMDVFPRGYKLSSNSPMIIMKEGRPWAALGTPGGHTIPQNMAQIVINLIDFKMAMQEAIDSPKVAFSDEGNIVCAEKELSEETIQSLEKLGHQVRCDNIASYVGLNGRIGNAMGVKMNDTSQPVEYDIGIDRRKDGWFGKETRERRN